MCSEMTTTKYLRHSQDLEEGHQSLRLFDVHDHPQSKIPVPATDRKSVARSKKSNSSARSSNTANDSNPSRIPVFKIAPTYSDSAYIRSPRTKESHKEKRDTSTPNKRIHHPLEWHHPEFMSIKSRKTVKLHGLELTSIPDEIFNRKDLESLILSPERESCLDFKLPFLPSAIGQLTKLRILVLDTNELQDIPEEIGNLHELQTLILGNNNLSNLPIGLQQLTKLRSLHLANNRFEEIPIVLCSLASLRFLDMSNNSLHSVPPEISQLSSTLTTLLLIMNEIEFLPDSFAQLTSLTCLWLGENNLRELPENFGELHKLDWGKIFCSSNIDGNPLERPPVAVCRQGQTEIKKYFHQLKHPKEKLSSSSVNKTRVTTKTNRKYK